MTDATTSDVQLILDDVALGESARWHDGRFWFCDWGTGEIVAVADRARDVVAVVSGGLPVCIDWLPDGRLLAVAGREGRLLSLEPDRSLVPYADLTGVGGPHPWNEVAVDARGNAFVNNIGFDFPAGEVSSGIVAVVDPDRVARQVADDLMFPNGMAVTPDDSTLIVAESYRSRLTAFDISADGGLSNRRVWAQLDQAAPDGICLDAEGAVWYADVPNRCCVRVREGGEVLQTVNLDRGCFSCSLSGPRSPTLFMVAAEYGGAASLLTGPRTGQVLAAPAPAPGARG